jgi:hypothetical protein
MDTKEPITHRLMGLERNMIILRKIFGPTYENGFWRIKSNQELDKTIKHKNIINFARAQRLGWVGHIERMPETRNPFQRGQQEDQRHGGRMMLKTIHRS